MQQIFHVTKDYLMELKNEEYWPAYTGHILCSSPNMKITSNGKPKSSRIMTDMNIREHHNRKKEYVPTLLDCALLVINYVMFHFAQTI